MGLSRRPPGTAVEGPGIPVASPGIRLRLAGSEFAVAVYGEP